MPAALFSLFLTDYDSIFPRPLDSDTLTGPSYNAVPRYGWATISDSCPSQGRRPTDFATHGQQQYSAIRSAQPNGHNAKRLSTTAVVHHQLNALTACERVSVDHPQSMNSAATSVNPQIHQQSYQARPPSQALSTTPFNRQTQPRDRASSGATFTDYHGPQMPATPHSTPLQLLSSPAPAVFNNDIRTEPQSPSISRAMADSPTYRSSAHGPLNFLAQSSPLTPLRKARPSSGLLADAPLARRPSASGSSDMQIQARRKSSMQRLKQIAGI